MILINDKYVKASVSQSTIILKATKLCTVNGLT